MTIVLKEALIVKQEMSCLEIQDMDPDLGTGDSHVDEGWSHGWWQIGRPSVILRQQVCTEPLTMDASSAGISCNQSCNQSQVHKFADLCLNAPSYYSLFIPVKAYTILTFPH